MPHSARIEQHTDQLQARSKCGKHSMMPWQIRQDTRCQRAEHRAQRVQPAYQQRMHGRVHCRDGVNREIHVAELHDRECQE